MFKIVEFARSGNEVVNKCKNFTNKTRSNFKGLLNAPNERDDAMIEILKIDKNTKIIFVSADVTMKKQVISKGTTGFLNKPFDIQELLNLIKRY